VLREASPFLIVFLVVVCLLLIFPIPLFLRGVISLASLIPAVYRMSRKFGDKAAGTVRDLVREPNYEGKMGFLYLVESDIRDVLDLASVTNKTPLVIFVDDLDRCVPHKVAEVVEAINLFLCGDYPNCIFVLAMEPGMVAAALQVANKDVIEKAVWTAVYRSEVWPVCCWTSTPLVMAFLSGVLSFSSFASCSPMTIAKVTIVDYHRL
jgi:uncharacterized RDD family membrane protein YckC